MSTATTDRAARGVALEIQGLGKSYGANEVLADVSFAVAPGEVLGLVGANGAGKSTLIKCLTGAVTADRGEIRVDGELVSLATPDHALRLGISAVQQEILLAGDHSVAENILLGRFQSSFGFTSPKRVAAQARDLLERVGLDIAPETTAGSLTPSKKRLVMIAAVLAREPRLVILDEPTAALPPEESAMVAALVRGLSADGVSVIYVSHRLAEVKRLAGRVVALRNGRLSGTLAGEEVTRTNMLRLIGGEEEPETLLVTEQHVHTEVRSMGKVILEARDLSGSRVRRASFVAQRGEILGVAGLAGSGRSELLRLLYGLQPVTGGTLHFDGQALEGSLRDRVQRRIGYVAELRASNVLHGLDVSRNLTIASIGTHRRGGVFADARWESETAAQVSAEVSLVGRPDAAIETLSGGNQQKILISRWLVRDTQVLLLDEPTAGVDLLARAEIHALLRKLTEQDKAVIVASVEADELTTICDRVVVMVEGELTAELTPPFSEEDLINAYYRDPSADGGDDPVQAQAN
jgi:ribose transport system ATP-binding protein